MTASFASVERLARELGSLDEPLAAGMRKFLLGYRDRFAGSTSEATQLDAPALASGRVDDLRAHADHSRPLLINLTPLNHIVSLNDYLREANRCLTEGGLLCGVFRPLESVRADFARALPPGVRQVLYFGHFVLLRVLPRLRVTGLIYSHVFRAPQLVLTRTEVFGRLRFCGFRVIANQEIDGDVYYLAQRGGDPHPGKAKNHGLLIRLERYGHKGEPIGVYKLRTMHPYSEHVQPGLFAHENLEDGGKLREDARVTGWGRILRRYWLDELPQVINWLRGEVTLVGVRAVSAEYLALLPGDVQSLRERFRPGLIPPYYADLPQNLREIADSERRYLLAKLERPFMTDLTYLLRACRNIATGARGK